MLYISELVAVNLRRKLMNKYLTLNLGFLQNFVSGSGGLISRMLNDIGVIQGGFQKTRGYRARAIHGNFQFWLFDLFGLAADIVYLERAAL